MDRITERDLETAVKALNREAGQKLEPYTNEGGKFTANVGTYFLDSAYGGHKLVQIMSDTGGQRSVSEGGYLNKKELYRQICAMTNVLATQQEGKEAK